MKRLSLKNALWMLFCLVFVVGLMGCQANQSQISTESSKAAGNVKYPLQLKDQAGNVVTIDKQPKRIVSLVPSNTEIAFALGLGKEVVAVTTNDDYPEQVKKLPKVGDMVINVEKVVAQKPDLVLASSMNGKETIDKLKQAGLTVLVLDANNIKQVYESIKLVGQATSHMQEADKLVAQMEHEKQEVVQKVGQIPDAQKKKVWLEISPDLYTAGNGTFLNELITMAGGKNIAADQQGWPQFSAEKVVQANPDVIISTYGSTKEILARPAFSGVTAVKNKQVFAIDPDILTRPGPRIVEGLKQLAMTLYPDRFK